MKKIDGQKFMRCVLIKLYGFEKYIDPELETAFQRLDLFVEEKPQTPNKNQFAKDSIEILLSERLFTHMKRRNPGYRVPNFQKWAVYVEKMLRIDKRNQDHIKEVIDWCQKDDFWQNNILSTEKLREKFDKLVLKKNREESGITQTSKSSISEAKYLERQNAHAKRQTANNDTELPGKDDMNGFNEDLKKLHLK